MPSEREDWWERLYRTAEPTQLPWYTPNLDPDIVAGLTAHGPSQGRILDLGTGPGTHAVGLARLGYDVVGTDISPSAIRAAKAYARKSGVAVQFRVDDILKSALPTGTFDGIVDRGVFHVLAPEARPRYAATVHRLLRLGGLLYLKAFSDKQPGDWGPHRLSREELRRPFRGGFDVLSIEDTEFEGTITPAPKALFAIFRRR